MREEIYVNGRRCHLSHTLPEIEIWETGKIGKKELIWGEPNYELCYDPDITFISGHTPTGLIDPEYAGHMWKGNGHIALDCGAVFDGGRIGCICLETMEENYA